MFFEEPSSRPERHGTCVVVGVAVNTGADAGKRLGCASKLNGEKSLPKVHEFFWS